MINGFNSLLYLKKGDIFTNLQKSKKNKPCGVFEVTPKS
jgi:hypothetical protein